MSRNPWNNRDWSNHPDLIYPDYKSTILRNPRKPLVKLDKIKHIPAPKFQISSLRPIDADLTLNSTLVSISSTVDLVLKVSFVFIFNYFVFFFN